MKAISCRMPVKIAAFFLLSVSLAFSVFSAGSEFRFSQRPVTIELALLKLL